MSKTSRTKHATWNPSKPSPPKLQRPSIIWSYWRSSIPSSTYVCTTLGLISGSSSSRDASRAAETDFKNLDYLITVKGIVAPQIKLIRTRYCTTYSRLVLVTEEVTRFEEENGYVERWTSKDKAYQDAVLMMAERRYRRALDELERLVVQRLMEMTKLSMSGVGKCISTI